MGGFGREVEGDTGIETLLHGLTSEEEALARRIECPVESGDELECAVGEDLGLGFLGLFGVNVYACDHGWNVGLMW